MEIKNRLGTKILLIIIFLLFQLSCKKENIKEAISKKEIIIEKVSIGNEFTKILKSFILEKTIKINSNCKKIIYDTSKINGKTDTITIYSFEKVVYKDQTLKEIDTKIDVTNDGKKMEIHKYYLHYKGTIAADDYADIIFYITNDGIIASLSTTSNFIYFYEPNRYSNFQKKISMQKDLGDIGVL